MMVLRVHAGGDVDTNNGQRWLTIAQIQIRINLSVSSVPQTLSEIGGKGYWIYMNGNGSNKVW